MSLSLLRDVLALINTFPLVMFGAIFFATMAILVVLQNWQLSLGALLLQYLVLGIILAQLIRPDLAFVKVLVGLFVCFMLFLSARRAHWRANWYSNLRKDLVFARNLEQIAVHPQLRSNDDFPPGHAFRIMLTLLIAVTSITLANTYPIDPLPFGGSMVVYCLCLNGLLILMLSEAPFKVGQGVLSILIGFELWFTVLESSLLMASLLATVNILIALAFGYLSIVHSPVFDEAM